MALLSSIQALFPQKVWSMLMISLLALSSCNKSAEQQPNASDAELWLTRPDQSVRFEHQQQGLVFAEAPARGIPVIEIDPAASYQSMEGFGYTFTGGSARLIHQLPKASRDSLLRELFSTQGIGVSYLRLSIGASDLSDSVFSYNDLPPGETDPELKRFSLEPERAHLIPVLKEILAIQPNIKFMGSPWSAPVWMKDNKDSRGGSLLKAYYPVYAQYFVRYIQEMAAEGIRIDAVTIQNEPLHPGNNPSMYMEAGDQAGFIRDHLGPAFTAAGIDTKIIIYDHNADRPDYPISILADAEAAKYIDGSAFHLYGGTIDALSKVHEAYPDKHLYFTEQWVGHPSNFAGDFGWHIRELIIGAPRNWCRTVLEWNLAADADQNPHTDRGGCTSCLGALTIDGSRITRNVAYYVIAHASKFVRPGSVRIASTQVGALKTVAYRTPENQYVLIVQNDSSDATEFLVSCQGKFLKGKLSAGAVGTVVWK